MIGMGWYGKETGKKVEIKQSHGGSGSQARAVLTVEEHVPQGGLGALVAQAVGANCPRKVVNLSLPGEKRVFA